MRAPVIRSPGLPSSAGEITRPLPGSYAAEVVGEGSGLVLGYDKAFLCQRNGDGSIRVYFAQRRTQDPNRIAGAAFKDPDFIRSELDRQSQERSPRPRSAPTRPRCRDSRNGGGVADGRRGSVFGDLGLAFGDLDHFLRQRLPA
jgi:hypothetical protein